MNRFLKKTAIAACSLFLLFGITGCNDTSKLGQDDAKVQEMIARYESTGKYEFEKEVRLIKPDENILFPTAPQTSWSVGIFDDFENRGTDILGHVPFEIYSDYALTDYVYSDRIAIKRDSETGEIKITPTEETPIYSLDGSKTSTVTTLYGGKTGWGLLNRFYVVQYHDLETKKLLEKPKVLTYQVDHSEDVLSAPLVKYGISENGGLELKWQPVEGANAYYIVQVRYRYVKGDKGWIVNSSAHRIGLTSKTIWNSLELKDSPITVNRDFRDIFMDTDDEKLRRLTDSSLSILDAKEDEDRPKDMSYLVVIAKDNTNYSAMSNAIYHDDIIKNLPYSIALNLWKKKVPHAKDYGIFYYEKMKNIPTHVPVTMCSGRARMMPIELKTEDVKEKNIFGKPALSIPIQILGTPFAEEIRVFDYNPSTYKEDLKKIQESIQSQAATGSIADDTTYAEAAELVLKSKVISNTIPEVEDEVFASNALSHFIAANLINQTDILDLAQFPQAGDRSVFADAYAEARTQNPTAPFVKELVFSSDGSKVEIIYLEKDKKVREQKQQEIREKLNAVAEEIKASNSDDLDKLKAINQYLCDNAEYDYPALERLNQRIAQKRALDDPNEADSFTAYGTGVKGIGVCASYANSFNYLARKVGLESIVVTGNINGLADLGHAWNAVKLNGKWKYFDTTFNDTGGDKDLYFNLDKDDPIMTETHVIGKDYVVKSEIQNYQ